MKFTKQKFVILFIFLLTACLNQNNEQMDLTKIPQSDKLLHASNRELEPEDIGETLGEVENKVDHKNYDSLGNWESTHLNEGIGIWEVISPIDGAEGKYFAYERDGGYYLFYEYHEE